MLDLNKPLDLKIILHDALAQAAQDVTDDIPCRTFDNFCTCFFADKSYNPTNNQYYKILIWKMYDNAYTIYLFQRANNNLPMSGNDAMVFHGTSKTE